MLGYYFISLLHHSLLQHFLYDFWILEMISRLSLCLKWYLLLMSQQEAWFNLHELLCCFLVQNKWQIKLRPCLNFVF